ncbi:YdcF family protein [Halobacillus sp. A1]|uniref:YdcF family protein n=1 Tax=Halobacillus sp. A1 TaxID=2880262 RepID=UPI0020A66FF9|nr:YdcF family protein [Halobacillus sp. A1]MCP3031357.1 YdcF family protein [Halobacillus sp. A1]
MKKLIKYIVILFIIYVAYTGYSIWTYGANNEDADADAAIILGAAQWNGTPSPVFEGRLKQGIELYKKGQVDFLIVTGGTIDSAEDSEGEVGKSYAMEQGVPEKDIIVEDKSLETEENLYNANTLIENRDIKSFLLVSDAFHLKRAVSIANERGMDAEGVATEYSAYESLETKLPFFFEEWAYYVGNQILKVFR